MARKWRVDLKSPEKVIKIALNKAVKLVFVDLEKWIRKELVKAMVDGGFGIEGIRDTAFYKFISSPEGLSQLGIEATEPPKLLQAYRRTLKIIRRGNQLVLQFGNTALLKLATPHPAAGTGNLRVESWLEWIVDDLTVDSGFVRRDRLPMHAKKRIRLGDPLGGLMLPRDVLGSTGLWRFPAQLQDYERDWLRINVNKIETAIVLKISELLAKRING